MRSCSVNDLIRFDQVAQYDDSRKVVSKYHNSELHFVIESSEYELQISHYDWFDGVTYYLTLLSSRKKVLDTLEFESTNFISNVNVDKSSVINMCFGEREKNLRLAVKSEPSLNLSLFRFLSGSPRKWFKKNYMELR